MSDGVLNALSFMPARVVMRVEQCHNTNQAAIGLFPNYLRDGVSLGSREEVHMERAALEDHEIHSRLRFEIERSIEDSERIQIKVKEGIVTLAGNTDNFADQLACENVARKTPGVAAVVQNIQLRLPASVKDSDVEIARKCKAALELNPSVPYNRLGVIVKDACVILKGEVHSGEQKQEAESTISKIPEVSMIKNEIVVKPGLKAAEIWCEIQRAFKRVVEHHAKGIEVEIHDGKAILSGIARAWFEIVIAENVVREIPEINEVVNKIELTTLLKGREIPPE